MRGIRVGSVAGIPIRLDVTFLVVLPLFAWLIGSDVAGLAGVVNGLFGSSLPVATLDAAPLRWGLGVAAAVGLFVGILLHELGHSAVAMHYGYGIDSITLWLFGGVARFAEIPEDWRQELVIAVAGPVVSLLVAAGALAGFVAVPAEMPAVRFVLGYLALANAALAAFNMLPGFPMDGGRVLRALLARSRPYARATQLAAEVGKGFAFLLGVVGLFANLLLVALAFFIYIGASSEARQTAMRAAFRGVTVSDVMTPREALDTVEEGTSVADLLDRMLSERHTGYPVLRDGELVGMVTLEDAREVREVERDAYRVGDVMTADVTTIAPDANAMDAVSTMQRDGIGRLPVVDAGDLVGLVSRTDVVTAFNVLESRGRLDGGSGSAGTGTDVGLDPR
ncbi:MAG: CBS domain-containing protein [Haloferacaceae archaeon]